ncbi:hypothetical protein CPC08DRAFT_708260 [Agrocybe pediades]|nr:hypothetical protein CPC08DRAFT_708260 [Agrocybe pediades]
MLRLLSKPSLAASKTVLAYGISSRRRFATVSPSILGPAPPPGPPPIFNKSVVESTDPTPPLLDRRILLAAERNLQHPSIYEIINQYVANSGNVVDVSLPYESRPVESRRLNILNKAESCRNVVTVAHCVQTDMEHKITLSSGFALNVGEGESKGDETMIVTCAHTLEEIRHSPILLSTASDTSKRHTGTFILTGSSDSLKVYPVSKVVSALPRSDLLLLSCPLPQGAVNTLPISPYPAHRDTAIDAHFVSHDKPKESGWAPWVGDTWGKWHEGKVLGYRDFAGRETEPGTYDALSHLLFTPLPTAGSSGGSILDKDSGAVIGVMLGTRMDNRVEGVRGWGVPSEAIFEMFALPGLEGKK